jgi:ankyrin repeat protein
MVCRDKDSAPLKRRRQLKYLTLATIVPVLLVGFICNNFNWGLSIHRAAEKGNIEAVKQHLDTGEDVNVKSDSGMTPLHHAAYRENKEVIELLIAKGASVNAQDVAGRTPLNVAIRYKRTETADILRKHGGKTSDWLNADDSIHNAASAGHIEAVKQHLAAGTDVDARDRQDKTPLQHAAYWGHKEIAELLIAKGADINAKDNAGTTTLDWGRIGKKQTEIADLLRKHGGKTGEELKAEGK